MTLDILSQVSPTVAAFLGADGALLIWLLKFYTRLNQDLKEIKMTLEFVQSDMARLHESVQAIEEAHEQVFHMSHEDARKFLHYHESSTDTIKRI